MATSTSPWFRTWVADGKEWAALHPCVLAHIRQLESEGEVPTVERLHDRIANWSEDQMTAEFMGWVLDAEAVQRENGYDGPWVDGYDGP